jgi:hypothetical protein
MALGKLRNGKVRRKNKMTLIIGFIFSALTLYVTVAYFFPRVTIYSAEPLNPASALETPFVISNDGTMPIFEVRYAYSILLLKTDDGLTINGDKKFRGRLKDSAKSISVMWPTDKYTVIFPLRSFRISPVSFADMAVVVQYRPLPLVPFVRERAFRFITAKTKDGQLNWYPQPLAMQLD